MTTKAVRTASIAVVLALFSTWTAVAGPDNFAAPTAALSAPVLIDTFSPAELVGVDLPTYGANLWTWGLALKADGTLLVACGSTVLAMDSRWQVTGLPAKKLSDEGNMLFAYRIFLTEAETMYLRSSDGSGLWAFPDGSPDYKRLRSEGQAGFTFGVLDDGSTFVVEGNSVRITRNGVDTGFALPENVSTIAAGAGPDDTIWVSDLMSGSILVLSQAGTELRRIKTDLALGNSLQKLQVQPDGSFFGVTANSLRRFDATGKTVWSWDGKDDGVSVMFSVMMDIAAGDNGMLYINDYLGRRILRLSERPQSLPASLKSVATAARAARAGGDRPELDLALADVYEAMGATEAARMALVRYLEKRPADARAQDRRLRLETALLKIKATAAGRDVLTLLERYGAETARDAYGRAMRTWESLRATAGDDGDVRAAMAALRSAFQAAERDSTVAASSPRVLATEISALFPALIRSYRNKPAGSILIRNTLPEPLRNVRADFYIKKYMDFPAEGKAVASVATGADVRLDLFAFLNESVLEVQEDLPLQAQVTLHFTDSRGERSIELSRQVMLYRRTAITWDDTSKLAAFVTPNEDSVARLAFEILKAGDGDTPVSRTFKRAQRICDALGALPLAYVPDPASPIAESLGATGQVDTVRFPRTTLAYKAGDCDDTTALLCSLLEAVGIPTAILTSPGHVFMAFDSGEPAENTWLFADSGLRTLTRDGTLWIPVETTILSDGFVAAWKAASDLVTRYAAGADFEFLPVAALRADFPPLPLSPSTLPLPALDAKRLSTLIAGSASLLESQLYTTGIKALEAERAKARGTAANRAGNRLAQLHVRFGHDDLAGKVLTGILTSDASYLPALLNLAGLAIKSEKKDEARAWLRRASDLAPGSTTVAAWIKAAGFSGEAGFGPALVEVAPEPASADSATSSGRAAAGMPGMPAWANE